MPGVPGGSCPGNGTPRAGAGPRGSRCVRPPGGTARSPAAPVRSVLMEGVSPSSISIRTVARALPPSVAHGCRVLLGSRRSIRRSHSLSLRGKSLDWNGKRQADRFENTNRLGCMYLNLLCCALIGDSRFLFRPEPNVRLLKA